MDQKHLMLEHIVLLKLKQGVAKSQVEAFRRNVLGLKDRIPGIMSISVGKNNSPENRDHGFGWGFVVRFIDSDSRDSYLLHTEHQKVAREHIIPIADDILVLDYDTEH